MLPTNLSVQVDENEDRHCCGFILCVLNITVVKVTIVTQVVKVIKVDYYRSRVSSINLACALTTIGLN